MKNLTKSLLALFILTSTFTVVENSSATKRAPCPTGDDVICMSVIEDGKRKYIKKKKGAISTFPWSKLIVIIDEE